MVKQYVFTIDDLRLLSKRRVNPCAGCKIECGSGVCQKKKEYDVFIKKIKDAGLLELHSAILDLDVFLSRKKDIQKQIDAVSTKISREYGTKILMDIARSLYNGEV